MEENKETITEKEAFYTIENYLRGLIPNAIISDDTLNGVLVDANVAPGTLMSELSQKDKDIAMAYLYIRVASNPIMSQKVTDKDADWEHSTGNEQWSRAQLQQFLILARKLLEKWGLSDPILDSVTPKWGMSGRGHRHIRKYK